MKVKYFKFYLALFFLFGILLFFIWSKLILVSLILVFIADSFTSKISIRAFKEKLPITLFNVFKYSYYIVLSVLFAIFLRIFLLDIYFVPSSSMERTLFPNDYVLVNKISYGTKIPKRIEDVPVIGSLFKKNHEKHQYDLYKSLKPFIPFKQGDIVVFKSLEDNNTFLIKRIIGMPGDTLEIKNAKVLINSNYLIEKESYCYNYYDNSISEFKIIMTYSNKEYHALDFNQKKKLKKDVKNKVKMNVFLFPSTKKNEWTRDNYGKLIIPKKGMEMILDKDNFHIYKYIIRNYESQTLELQDNEVITFTFKNNYYFMMGDNRHGSSDSRNFGFVPESYIQGKMIKVFSKSRLFN